MDNALEKRKQFPFYLSFMEALDECPVEFRLNLYEGIVHYAFLGEEPDYKSPIERMVWKAIKPNLDSSMNHFLAGCKGGNPKGNVNNPHGHNQFSNREDNQMDNQMDNQRITKRISNKNNKEEDIKKKVLKKNETSNEAQTEQEKEFIDYMNNNYPSVMSMIKPLTYSECSKLRETYTKEQVNAILTDMENMNGLNKKYKSAYLTANKWLKNNYGSKKD